MHLIKTTRVALMALGRNKMRSFLTALGIIIGVGAVIAMVSMGQGAKQDVEDRFNAMGNNLLTVRAGSRSYRGVHGGGGSYENLTPADVKAIREQADAVQYLSPSVSTRSQIVYGSKNWNTSIYGVGQEYPQVRNWEIQEGSFFDENAVRAGQKVCVLGSEVSWNLFEGADSIGQVIRIKNVPFRVIGVLEERGEAGGWGSRDDMIAVPYTTVQRLTGRTDRISSIDVSAYPKRVDEAAEQMSEILRIRHKLAPGAEDDFNIRNMADIAEGAAESGQILTILLGGIAMVSLLVGGIGIMNIMLVSVTERIREIGIRMSVGAREKDILLQFLTEAIVLSFLGGILGIGFGILASRLISQFAGWPTLIPIAYILFAFLFSGSVGVFFGFYPARKASKLDPIEALRFE